MTLDHSTRPKPCMHVLQNWGTEHATFAYLILLMLALGVNLCTYNTFPLLDVGFLTALCYCCTAVCPPLLFPPVVPLSGVLFCLALSVLCLLAWLAIGGAPARRNAAVCENPHRKNCNRRRGAGRLDRDAQAQDTGEGGELRCQG